MAQESGKPILSKKNQYHGINAHLNTILQEEGWEGFHTYHIVEMATVLNDQLEGTGYYADIESGLQIRNDEGFTRHPKADVLIADHDPERHHQGRTSFPSREYLITYDVTALVTPADLAAEYYPAVGIYDANLPAGSDRPVAWIELLSPTNKRDGAKYREYVQKREIMVNRGTCVYVEIDYLHQMPPTLKIPDYTRAKKNATPFRVAIIDKRPPAPDDYDAENLKPTLGVIQFGVDEKIPPIPIPLYGGDTIDFNLDEAYQASFERGIYGTKPNTAPNYAELPIHIRSYNPADQTRIINRMVLVIDAAHNAAAENLALDDYLAAHQIEIPLPLDNSRLAELHDEIQAFSNTLPH